MIKCTSCNGSADTGQEGGGVDWGVKQETRGGTTPPRSIPLSCRPSLVQSIAQTRGMNRDT